jgi:hypothetical protein
MSPTIQTRRQEIRPSVSRGKCVLRWTESIAQIIGVMPRPVKTIFGI